MDSKSYYYYISIGLFILIALSHAYLHRWVDVMYNIMLISLVCSNLSLYETAETGRVIIQKQSKLIRNSYQDFRSHVEECRFLIERINALLDNQTDRITILQKQRDELILENKELNETIISLKQKQNEL